MSGTSALRLALPTNLRALRARCAVSLSAVEASTSSQFGSTLYVHVYGTLWLTVVTSMRGESPRPTLDADQHGTHLVSSVRSSAGHCARVKRSSDK
jgi:hypothetical protein